MFINCRKDGLIKMSTIVENINKIHFYSAFKIYSRACVCCYCDTHVYRIEMRFCIELLWNVGNLVGWIINKRGFIQKALADCVFIFSTNNFRRDVKPNSCKQNRERKIMTSTIFEQEQIPIIYIHKLWVVCKVECWIGRLVFIWSNQVRLIRSSVEINSLNGN